MRKIYLLLLMALPLITTAQKNPIDSLLAEADKNVHDSIKVKTYYELGRLHIGNNPKKARENFEKMRDLAINLDDTIRLADAYFYIGYTYFFEAKYDKALENYLEAAKKYELLKNYSKLSNIYTYIGSVHIDNSNIEKGSEYYKLAETTVLKINDSNQLAKVYSSMGQGYDKAKKYDSSVVYYNKSYDIFSKKNRLFETTNVLIGLSITYKHMDKTTEALQTLNTVKRNISGKQLPNDLWAVLYNNIGATYSQAKQYGEAVQAFDSSLILAKQLNASGLIMENYRNLSDLYAATNNPAKEAAYLRQYYVLKDSIFSSDTKNQLVQLDADYQLEKKNAELAKKDAEVVKRKSQRNVLLIISIAAAAILLGLLFFYSRIRKKNSILHQQNETINKQNTELQTLNSVKDRLFSIISHDLRNPLVTLQSYLTLTNNDALPADKKEQYRLQTVNAVAQTSNMLDNLLAWANMQIKNTKASITPIDIDELVADTKSGAEAQATQKQIIIHEDLAVTTVPGDYNILSIALRNLLTNAIKFSDKEGNIWINAEKAANGIILSVKDEGVGMSKQQLQELNTQQQSSSAGTAGEKGTGLGLYLVQELLHKINAKLEVKSEQGQGSTFSIVIPS